MKISLEDEYKFALAAGLHRRGRFSNTVYAKGESIFVYNTDHTVLIHFEARRFFSEEIRFFADDYSSDSLEMKDEGIVFHKKLLVGKDATAKIQEFCRVPIMTFDEVKEIYEKYIPEDKINKIDMTKELMGVLKEKLSHVEFGSDGDKFIMVQRDLYSGKIITTSVSMGKFGLTKGNVWNFQGFRTSDVLAIFEFSELVSRKNTAFYFVDPFYTWIENESLRMTGILTTCVYDELGTLGVLEE